MLKYLRPAGPFPILPQEAVANVAAGDFQLFDVFIFLTLSVAALRLIIGVWSRGSLEDSRAKLDRMRTRGYSTKILVIGLVFTSLTMALSLHFALTVSTDLGKALLVFSPRWFVCMHVFLFSGAAFLIVEVALSLASLIFTKSASSLKGAHKEV